jgi:transcription termination factor NusB
MFEGLRGLRDAVAPESGNLAGEGNPTAPANATAAAAADENMDESWLAYQRGDPSTVRWMQSIVSSANSTTVTLSTTPSAPAAAAAATATAAVKVTLPTNVKEFARLYNNKMQVEKDTQLVLKLAGTVLEKSRQIDKRVDDYLMTPPNKRMRTVAQQMQRIQELLALNQQVTVELEQAHGVAKARRDVCRRFIRDNTCAALGIEQIND